MIDTTNPHVALSDNAANLIEHAASSVVSVHGGSRRSSSGIHWRSGIIVTAEEVLERDEDIKLTLPGGQTVDASLVGRDPTTDVAVLRFQPDGLLTAATATASLRAGEIIFGVGSHEGTPLAAFGIVALASGAWRSSRGGTIDHFIRLDLALNPVAEGGALIDAQGRVLGMTVLGPRRRALAIPTSTIERAVDQLLAGAMYFVPTLALVYARLGANAAKTAHRRRTADVAFWSSILIRRGLPNSAGLLVGDVITSWNAKPIDRVRDVMHLLGPGKRRYDGRLGLGTRRRIGHASRSILGERPIR